MDRFHKFSILALVLLSITVGWEAYALPAPGRNSVVTPGGQTVPCTYDIYIDGSSFIAKNCKTGDNDFSSTTATTTFQNAINGGGLIYFEGGLYNLGASPTQVNLVNNLWMIFSPDAIIKVSSAGNNFKVFAGVSITNVTISGGQFDGTTGTRTSGSENVNFFSFTGTANAPSRAIIVEKMNFRNLSGSFVGFSRTNDIVVVNNVNTDPVTTGGFTGDSTYIQNALFANNNLRIWDTALGFLGSSNVTVANNIFQGASTGQAIDLIQNTATTDTDRDILISGNQCVQFGTCISIHDTLSTTFQNIKITGNNFRSFGGAAGSGDAIGVSSNNDIKGLDISDNSFFRGDKAVILSRVAGNNFLNRMTIRDNNFIDLGNNICAMCPGYGIWNNGAGTIFNDTIITGNLFFNISATAQASQAIDCLCASSLIANNKFIGARTMNALSLQDPGLTNNAQLNVVINNQFEQIAANNLITGLGRLANQTIIQFNQNFNPIGKMSNFIKNNYIGYCGLAGGTTVVSSINYRVCTGDIYFTSSGGTGVSITIMDTVGNTVYAPGATLSVPFYVPRGSLISFGGFSVAPTVTVWAY